MNGHMPEPGHLSAQSLARPQTPPSHLGKRKRSASPTKPVLNGDTAHASPDPTIEKLVREIKE